MPFLWSNDVGLTFFRPKRSAEDDVVDETLDADMPLGRLVARVLDPKTVSKPSGPFADAVEQWESPETFLESRLRQE